MAIFWAKVLLPPFYTLMESRTKAIIKRSSAYKASSMAGRSTNGNTKGVVGPRALNEAGNGNLPHEAATNILELNEPIPSVPFTLFNICDHSIDPSNTSSEPSHLSLRPRKPLKHPENPSIFKPSPKNHIH
jgi:hypothetical protein